jgi:hypothetical protein
MSEKHHRFSVSYRARNDVAFALKSGSKNALDGACTAATLLSQCRREMERTRENAEALRTIAMEFNDHNRSAIGQFYLGRSNAMLGNRAPGIEQMSMLSQTSTPYLRKPRMNSSSFS